MSASRACSSCHAPLPDEVSTCPLCGSPPSDLSEPHGVSEVEFERLTNALKDRYQVERELGRGGMATVYLAEDLRHQRRVAVKVMRPDVASALGSRRFLREINVAAGLAHPHILPIHDSGEADGLLFYVMPFLEGETLGARLNREGGLPIPDVIRIVRDVADALSFAHGRGIVHRDIKPGNIILSGRHALVIDFGVAKAVTASSTPQRLTTHGVAVGTPVYMSPEQASGESALDHRVDIYALGVVAYELLAGEPPFLGRTAKAVMSKHITDEPVHISERRPSVPAPLAELVMRALSKNAGDRWRDADELLSQLELIDTTSGASPPLSKRGLGPHRWAGSRALAGLTAAASIAAVLLLGSQFLGNSSAPQIMNPMNLRQLTFSGRVGSCLDEDLPVARHSAISPDGRYLTYTELGPNREPCTSALWVSEVGVDAQALQLASEWSMIGAPDWSSDGSEVVFVGVDPSGSAETFGIFAVPFLGGPVRRLAPAQTVGELAHSRSRIAYWRYNWKEIGTQDLLTGSGSSFSVSGDYTWLLEARWSPDDAHFAVLTLNDDRPRWTASTLATASGEEIPLLSDSVAIASLRWGGTGALYYLRESGSTADLWKIRLNNEGQPLDSPALVLPGLFQAGSSFGLSAESGRLVYTQNADYENLDLYAFDDGPGGYVFERALTTGTSSKGRPVISPDGEWVVFTDGDGSRSQIFKVHVGGGARQQLTFLESQVSSPVWSPDGQMIAFLVRTTEGNRLATVPASGEPRVEVFQETEASQDGELAWAPGERILYQPPGNRNFSLIDPGTGAERPLVENDSVGFMFAQHDAVSPDGEKVLLTWNRNDSASGFWVVSLIDGSQTLLAAGQRGDAAYWASDSESVWWFDAETNQTRRRTLDGVLLERSPYEMPDTCSGAGHRSADRRRFVCHQQVLNRDIWLIENFDPGFAP